MKWNVVKLYRSFVQCTTNSSSVIKTCQQRLNLHLHRTVPIYWSPWLSVPISMSWQWQGRVDGYLTTDTVDGTVLGMYTEVECQSTGLDQCTGVKLTLLFSFYSVHRSFFSSWSLLLIITKDPMK